MKNNITNIFFTIILLIVSNLSNAQEKELKNLEKLEDRNYSYLENASNNKNYKKEVNLEYAKAWLSKSKADENWFQSAKAYKALMHLEEKTNLLKYADSLVVAALRSKNNQLIGNAYLSKGIILNDRKEISKALDNYLIADQFLTKTNDEYSSNKLKYSIAHTKYYLGFYDEAIALFKGCLAYFEEESERGYLNTLHSLGLCYNKIGNYNKCTYYNELGLKESLALENTAMVPYFKHSEAINQYYKKEYTAAIHKLKEVMPGIKEKKDVANETLANFYIGKSHWELKHKEEAILYLLRVDSTFVEKKYLHPVFRENYELLIKHYAEKNNLKLQLTYINKLMEVDKMLNKNYKYLSQKIFKEYDTKKLIAEKQEVERTMKTKSSIHYLLGVMLSLIIVFLGFRHYKNEKFYKAKFNELMHSNISNTKINNTDNQELDINPEIVEVIIKNLEKFEKNKKYLEKDMSLIRIASLLHTNTKYASKIIFKYRGKKTIDYINDLKIEHIISLLKNDKKYRLYTNKALGEEIGFGSTQNFTRAFKNKTDISPTYFIQKLNEIPKPKN
ncbi:AraC family transcriptional regulator [uncultured Flavobacterium sp.]|mgnify:CR=1 FL=1|uniref:AraC family transcriptional regulator n=1 Tax=uncultured Flavobacterium sp. TaxID=165435 RepID=UPI0030EF38A1|tara:strand:+ start:45744 stop:47423 length:1680 start_codon:yes stop_codon:yes gene_type:complete